MPTVQGDILQLFRDGKFNAIVHGCNCFNAMSGGIAAQIARQYPDVEYYDSQTVAGDETKLGTIEVISVHHGYVINAYTQYYPGASVDYDAIDSAFLEIRKRMKYCSQWRLGYPAIGAGIAGGDWGKISKIIARRLRGLNHMFVEYRPS